MSRQVQDDFELELGLGHHRAGRVDAAERAYRKVLDRDANHSEANRLLGLLRLQAGESDAAIEHLTRAVAAASAGGLARENLADAYLAAGRGRDALDEAQALLKDEPGRFKAWMTAGKAAMLLLEYPIAIRCFDQATGIDSDSFQAYYLGGLSHFRMGRMPVAGQWFRDALQRDQEQPLAWYHLGQCYLAFGRDSEAEQCLDTAMRLDDDCGAAGALWALRRRIFSWETDASLSALAVRDVERAIARSHEAQLSPAILRYLPLTPGQRSRVARHAVNLGVGKALAQRKLLGLSAAADAEADRIRVAYLVGATAWTDFRGELDAVLASHDRERFEIIACHTQSEDRQPGVGAWLGERADLVLDLSDANPVQAATRLSGGAVDLLVDLESLSGRPRLDILALANVPVRVNWLGYFGTSGSTELAQYVITDALAVPDPVRDQFVEAVVRLPAACLAIPVDLPDAAGETTREALGLPDDAVVLSGLCDPLAVCPALLATWLRVLKGAPDAVLLMNAPPGYETTLRQRAIRAGVSGDRLHFVDLAADPSLRRAALGLADLHLDTVPYSSPTMVKDALAVGVPALAVVGDTCADRVAASLLAAAGLAEQATDDARAYEAAAQALAGDAEAIAALKSRLAEARSSAPLFDAGAFVGRLEQAYEDIWARHRAGEAPAALDIPAATGDAP